jgi:hypothetical protein
MRPLNSDIEIWIGLAHVKPKQSNVDFGTALGGFLPVVGFAQSAEDFETKAELFLAQGELDVIEIEDIERWEFRILHYPVADEIRAAVSSLNASRPITTSTILDTYDSLE